jgi:hypothetical protein
MKSRTERNNRLRWFFQRTSSFRSLDKLIYREELDSGYDDPPTLRWHRPVADHVRLSNPSTATRPLVMRKWETRKDRNLLHSYSESKLDSEPWQIPPDLITRFYINGCATRRAVALRRRIFKQKKWFANLSLGLNYHSKALPQPPSRDTVPLIFCLYYWLKTLFLQTKNMTKGFI